MALIDLDKFIASIMYRWNNPEMKTIFNDMKYSLIDQGLEYKDNKIVKTQRRVSAEAKENGYSESGEERIREAITHFISHTPSIPKGIIGKETMLAWLEKQVQKKCIEDLTQQEAMDIAVAKCFEQGKKKYALDIEIPFGAKDSELHEVAYIIPEGFHAEIKGNEVLIKKGKQASIWSEDDERNLQGIIDEIEANKSQAPDYDLTTYDRFISWLKSLKQRHTWKPSDEQIGVIEAVINNRLFQRRHLDSLYEQLKKLKGE